MITKEKVLEILEQNSIISRAAGRVVIYENDWENIAEEIVKNCSIQSVSVSSSIKNIPDKIYLQIGESDVTENQSITDWNELFHGAITWADERINKSDIEYSR